MIDRLYWNARDSYFSDLSFSASKPVNTQKAEFLVSRRTLLFFVCPHVHAHLQIAISYSKCSSQTGI